VCLDAFLDGAALVVVTVAPRLASQLRQATQ
jgi:hypothetical protein